MALAKSQSAAAGGFGRKNLAVPRIASAGAGRQVQPVQATPELEIAARAPASAAGRSDMMNGALWGIGGAAVTLVTYQMAASHGGGTFMVAWGAMIIGALRFLRGAWRSYVG